jgi:hypothetical protein
VKINIDTKRSSYSEKDCFENHRTTAVQVTAELNIHLEDPAAIKLSNVSFTNPKSFCDSFVHN